MLPITRRLTVPALAVAALALAACSSGGASGSASASSAPTSAAPTDAAPSSATPASPSATASGAPCTPEAVQVTLPAGSEITTLKCDSVPEQQWAAGKATAAGGEVVFFAKADAPGYAWQAVPAEEICGTASAGLPPKILALCPS